MDDDDITFDNPAAVREMKHRHASLGRRALAIVDVALRELEEKIARGEPLNMERADALALREVGEKMVREALEHEADAPIPPPKPN
jgi:hypothetical protein